MSYIKNCFPSRFKEKGYICEADFSQLEIVIKGQVTKCKTLCEDIKNGVDAHSKSASFMFGLPYEKILAGVLAEDKKYVDMRQQAKQPSFQASYGATAAGMARSLRMSLDLCQTYLDNYDNTYIGTVKFNEKVARDCEKTAVTSKYNFRPEIDKCLRIGYTIAETGRRYAFKEEVREYTNSRTRQKEQKCSFRPTVFKNYPIQGGGADFMSLCLGIMYKELMSDERFIGKVFLINCIHDSFVFDCHDSVVHDLREFVIFHMTNTTKYYTERFNVPFPLPIGASFEVGRTWGEKKAYNKETIYDSVLQ